MKSELDKKILGILFPKGEYTKLNHEYESPRYVGYSCAFIDGSDRESFPHIVEYTNLDDDTLVISVFPYLPWREWLDEDPATIKGIIIGMVKAILPEWSMSEPLIDNHIVSIHFIQEDE